MKREHIQEIRSMSNETLVAAYRVVYRQAHAPMFIGDRENRFKTLAALQSEGQRRGLI